MNSLRRVREQAAAVGEEEETLDGIDLKRELASSRASIVEGVLTAQIAGTNYEGWTHAKLHFETAANALKRLDLLGLGVSLRQLTRAERSLIMGMLAVTELGGAACRLWLAEHGVPHRNSDLAIAALDDIDTLADQVQRNAADGHWESLSALASNVNDTANQLVTASSGDRGPPSRAVFSLLDALVEPMPRPGMCPLLASGQASLAVNGIGALSGDGSHDFPFEFRADSLVALDVTVAVARRGRGDVLRFTLEDAPPTARDSEQIVQVHENYFSLRPVILETAVVTSGPMSVTLSLAFQTPGCRVETDRRVVWYRAIKSDTEGDERADEVAKLRESIRRRRQQIRQLEDVRPAESGGSPYLQIRQLETELKRDEAALAALER